MKPSMKQQIATLLAAGLITLGAPTSAHPQQAQDRPDAAIDHAPASDREPSLDELLGLDDEGNDAKPDAVPKQNSDPDPANPELTRELEKRLSGKEASEQFVQAIAEMEEIAIRLGEESDPGIDTQRMQDEIILKLEQIISSAEKTPSQQQQPQQGQSQPGQPRQADKGGQQPQPGQQQGQQQGPQQGQQPGQEQGEQPGQRQGQGEPQGQQPGNESGQNGSAGSVRNEELSMKDLREGEWGNLPPRLRDELAESLNETFNPVYRSATEAFYRRIAELSAQQAEEDE